jgi:hypothetical protein
MSTAIYACNLLAHLSKRYNEIEDKRSAIALKLVDMFSNTLRSISSHFAHYAFECDIKSCYTNHGTLLYKVNSDITQVFSESFTSYDYELMPTFQDRSKCNVLYKPTGVLLYKPAFQDSGMAASSLRYITERVLLPDHLLNEVINGGMYLPTNWKFDQYGPIASLIAKELFRVTHNRNKSLSICADAEENINKLVERFFTEVYGTDYDLIMEIAESSDTKFVFTAKVPKMYAYLDKERAKIIAIPSFTKIYDIKIHFEQTDWSEYLLKYMYEFLSSRDTAMEVMDAL